MGPTGFAGLNAAVLPIADRTTTPRFAPGLRALRRAISLLVKPLAVRLERKTQPQNGVRVGKGEEWILLRRILPHMWKIPWHQQSALTCFLKTGRPGMHPVRRLPGIRRGNSTPECKRLCRQSR